MTTHGNIHPHPHLTSTMSIPHDLIPRVAAYVKQHMDQNDGSHDYNHIKRVLGLARHIAAQLPAPPLLDPTVITLSALLHDIGDRKYLREGESSDTAVHNLLVALGAPGELAEKIQTICAAVSYSTEVRDRERVRRLVQEYPELGVVQDADRLDALGAVGIGRVFMYGGARTGRGLEGFVEMFEMKLLLLEAGMKTDPGREMARIRTERLRAFKRWWEEERGMMVEEGEIMGEQDGDRSDIAM